MRTAVLLIGILILILLVVDVIVTTLGQGGGPITRRQSSRLWRMALSMMQGSAGFSHQFLGWAGLFVVLSIIGAWVLLLWGGWTLVFAGALPDVMLLQDDRPADFWETMYFAGSAVFTLGFGDYAFEHRVWQLVSVAAGYSGLFVVTLAITYLTPVMQAVTQKRHLSAYITAIGSSPAEILKNTWNGKDWSALESHLVTLTSQLSVLQQRYLAYPVLHFFHSRNRASSAATSIAALDDALTILEHGVQSGARINPGIYHPARSSVSALLDTLKEAFIPPADREPPLPSIVPLRQVDLPVIEDEEFRKRASGIGARRRLLLGFVTNDGWKWDNVSDL